MNKSLNKTNKEIKEEKINKKMFKTISQEESEEILSEYQSKQEVIKSESESEEKQISFKNNLT